MFQCKDGCKAECCGVIPIPRQTYRKHKKKIPDSNIDKIYSLKDEVFVITQSGFCAFLNDGKCRIYQDRPLVCKLYGIDMNLPCPYVRADGTLRQENETKAIQDRIKTTVDTALIALVK